MTAMVWPRFLSDEELEEALEAAKVARRDGDESSLLAADLAAIEEEYNRRHAPKS